MSKIGSMTFRNADPERPLFAAARLVDPLSSHGLGTIRIVRKFGSESCQFLAALAVELLDRYMIHSGRPLVPHHLAAGKEQVLPRIDLVNQRVPSSSSHSLFESRQHGVRPDAQVRPVPEGRRLSGRCSRERHFGRWWCSFVSVHSSSTSLRPFAPPELPGFITTMDALTPVRGLFVRECPIARHYGT